LGATLRDRRIRDLGVAQLTEFSKLHKIGYRILTDLEAGRRVNFASKTKAAVESAYALPEGALDRVLSGEWQESALRRTDPAGTADSTAAAPPTGADTATRSFTMADTEARSLVTLAYDLGDTTDKENLLNLALQVIGKRGAVTVGRH
jgi:hypothetical protein